MPSERLQRVIGWLAWHTAQSTGESMIRDFDRSVFEPGVIIGSAMHCQLLHVKQCRATFAALEKASPHGQCAQHGQVGQA